MLSLHSSRAVTAAAALIATFVVLGSLDAIAYPFTANDRSVLLTENSTSSEPSLESILLDSTSYGGGFGLADQSTNALFSPIGSSVITGLVIEYAGYAPNNKLGIYNLAETEVILFEGSDSSGATIEILFSGNDLTVGGTTYTDFGTAFGFYLQNDSVGFTFFSQDALNPGGRAHFLAYEEGDSVFFGFEDLDLGDRDYNDFVASAKGISGTAPIPEPSSALVFSIGTLVVASSIRRSRAPLR